MKRLITAYADGRGLRRVQRNDGLTSPESRPSVVVLTEADLFILYGGSR
jgi:hypothetical protein